jgi:hypothetical protein
VGVRNVKVLYSLRHRAKDTLRAEECPEKIAEAIFGRDEVTIGDKYGVGFPVTVLKKWIDKILPGRAANVASEIGGPSGLGGAAATVRAATTTASRLRCRMAQ